MTIASLARQTFLSPVSIAIVSNGHPLLRGKPILSRNSVEEYNSKSRLITPVCQMKPVTSALALVILVHLKEESAEVKASKYDSICPMTVIFDIALSPIEGIQTVVLVKLLSYSASFCEQQTNVSRSAGAFVITGLRRLVECVFWVFFLLQSTAWQCHRRRTPVFTAILNLDAMRRAGTAAPISDASSTTSLRINRAVSQAPPVRRGKRRVLQTSSKSAEVNLCSSYSFPLLFFMFTLLLVMTDLFYLYRLSSGAVTDDSNRASNLKGTRLSRMTGSGDSPRNTTGQRFGISKHFHEGYVHIQNLHPPPPFPESIRGLEIEQEQSQISAQQDRNPPKQSLDMLHHQALAQGFQNLDDKEPIMKILQQAGLQIQDMDQRTIDELPTWSQIQRLYGKEPRIVGLETCEAFRECIDARTRFFGVAGTFNSGTNLGKDWVAP
jgi:hypothetical protein